MTAAPAMSPEPPVLTSEVRLLGELPGVGFERKQFLIQKGDTYLQTTELLYRVLEQVDGQQTTQEIAARITGSTEWIVTAPQVCYILAFKLAPLSLIAADMAPFTGTKKPSRSPLALYMRMKTVGPGVVDPIAKALKFLHSTPFLIPLLVLAALAHTWLYRVQGLTAALQDALKTPGGLLLVIGIVVGAGFVHEFGHASALRSGGGTVRGMGIGLYLMYPAFYTDVTDAYRLGRWARVRVDLGGVYFHFLFCGALIGLSVATGFQLLLLPVLLINIDILRQFIPFVRLDGYWLLGDLTGIPDFFSQMAPFLRSLLPRTHRAHSEFPALRGWVRVVFLVYTFAVIPVLAYLFFLMVRALPSLVERTFQTLGQHGRLMSISVHRGDLITIVLLGLTMFLVAATLAGSLYVVLSTVAFPVKAGWAWSRSAPLRRVGFVSISTATAAAVAFLSYPDVKAAYARWNLSSVSERGPALLAAAHDATARLSTLTADIRGALNSDAFTGTVVLKRPNLARIDISSDGGLGKFSVISNGRRVYTWFPADKQFSEMPPGADGRFIRAYVADQIEFFFRPQSIIEMTKTGAVHYSGPDQDMGIQYDVVTQSIDSATNLKRVFAIGKSDGVIHGLSVVTTRQGGNINVSWVKLMHVRTNVRVDDSIFRWQPSKDAGTLSLPSGLTAPGLGTASIK